MAAWSGPSCAVLALQPANTAAGLHAPGGRAPNTSSWGGAVAYDEASQRWQMFAAEMVNGCGIGAWESNSRVVRASAASANGEYVVEEEIKPAFSHEPMLARLSDGRWLLYSIGGPKSVSGQRNDCSDGYTPQSGGPSFSGPVPVEIYTADKLTGPWDRSLAPAGDGDINPAPLVFRNGTAVMMWRGGDAWFHVHLARAQSWDAVPYAYNGSGTIFPGFDHHGIEDPFVYSQPAPHIGADAVTYHAIFHDHSSIGGHAFSRDAVSWTYSTTVPFNATVAYEDGSSVVLQRRERPHLIFDDAGFITHLTSGAQPPPSARKSPPVGFQNDFTYTLVQPVRRQAASRDVPHA